MVRMVDSCPPCCEFELVNTEPAPNGSAADVDQKNWKGRRRRRDVREDASEVEYGTRSTNRTTPHSIRLTSTVTEKRSFIRTYFAHESIFCPQAARRVEELKTDLKKKKRGKTKSLSSRLLMFTS